MRVFVTGATGFIGSAIVRELVANGHEVLGLARSDEGAAKLEKAGVAVHRGSLEDVETLKNAAAKADGVIHTAFIHDFSNMPASAKTDTIAIQAMGSVLAGSGRPLVIASGTALLAQGKLGTENDEASGTVNTLRAPSEQAITELAAQGVRSSVVRLPPSVHGEGDHGFMHVLIGIARQTGVSAYVADGLNRWPAVHRLDAARVFRLALEKGTPGARYHAVGDEGVPTRVIATAIGRGTNLPVQGGATAEHFGWMGHFFSLDVPASSMLTRERLGWEPTGLGLIADLEQGHYFHGG